MNDYDHKLNELQRFLNENIKKLEDILTRKNEESEESEESADDWKYER